MSATTQRASNFVFVANSISIQLQRGMGQASSGLASSDSFSAFVGYYGISVAYAIFIWFI